MYVYVCLCVYMCVCKIIYDPLWKVWPRDARDSCNQYGLGTHESRKRTHEIRQGTPQMCTSPSREMLPHRGRSGDAYGELQGRMVRCQGRPRNRNFGTPFPNRLGGISYFIKWQRDLSEPCETLVLEEFIPELQIIPENQLMENYFSQKLRVNSLPIILTWKCG